MKPGSQTRVNVSVGGGIALATGGFMIIENAPGSAPLGWIMIACGWVAFLAGCCLYADGKGHASKWGMLGLFGIFGLIVLVLFSDRCKYGRAELRWGDDEDADDRPRRRRLVGESNLPWREQDADQPPPREERDDDDDRRRASKPWDRGTR